jgi:uncharacterized coiled-coil DUF342 family protein
MSKFRIIMLSLILAMGFLAYGEKDRLYTAYLLEKTNSQQEKNIHLKKEAVVISHKLKNGKKLSVESKERLIELHSKGIITASMALIEIVNFNRCETLDHLIENIKNSAILESEISMYKDHTSLNGIFSNSLCAEYIKKWTLTLHETNNDEENVLKRIRDLSKNLEKNK